MTYNVYVDNECEETDLELDEAIDLEQEILEECPTVQIRIEPVVDESDEEEDEEDFEEEE